MHKLNHSSDCRKLLLAIAGIAAAAVPMITGRMSALAQTQTASTPVLSFEIASIKAENAFPRPLLLLEDARTLLQKRKLCPKKLCHPRGSPQPFPSNFRPLQEQGKWPWSPVSDTRCGT